MGHEEVSPVMSDAVTSEPSSVPPGRDVAPDPSLTLPPVPWDVGEIVFLFIVVVFLLPWAALEFLRATGFFSWYYPGEPAGVGDKQQLWPRALAFPFQVATILGVLGLAHGGLPAALGLTRQNLGRNVKLGIATALVLTPVVIGLHQTLVWVYTNWLHFAVQEHPLGKLGQLQLTPVEMALWLFVPIVAAPVTEELMFRGVFQPWARKTPWGGAAGFGLAGLLAVGARWDRIDAAVRETREHGWAAAPNVLDAFSPLLFVLALVPVLIIVMRRGRGQAVLGTSVLFAMVHAGVWPSPVALLVLALGLGWLKERTGSLVGPMIVHSLFNGVNCGIILLGPK
jgi:membrane protease YdiL (CAAX protease family)